LRLQRAGTRRSGAFVSSASLARSLDTYARRDQYANCWPVFGLGLSLEPQNWGPEFWLARMIYDASRAANHVALDGGLRASSAEPGVRDGVRVWVEARSLGAGRDHWAGSLRSQIVALAW